MTPGSIRILRIRGINLNLHYSLLILLFYIVIVAGVQMPLVAASAGIPIDDLSGPPMAWGLVFAFGLFASIALHEFGHALVAQALGVPVKDITLMMLGGVAHLERVPEQKMAEFKLSVVGPLVSLVLGAVFLWGRNLAPTPNLTFLLHWMGSANVVLGVFNLLPAFPLDGGRALRSILAVRRERVEATRIAVSIGRVSAWILGGIGLLQFNLILMFIAFFIYSAGQSELMVEVGRRTLEGMKVRDAIEVRRILEPMDTLEHAARLMLEERLPVVAVNLPEARAAVFSIEGLRQVDHRLWAAVRVRDALEPCSKVLHSDRSLSDAFTEVLSSPQRPVPVYDGDQVVGLIQLSGLTDLIRFRDLMGLREKQRREAA